MKTSNILYFGGLSIVIGSHYALLTNSIPPEWDDTFKLYHAPANLVAAGMIVVSNVV